MPATVLFGPFDRHNLGDLLFPHVAAAFLPDRDLHFAGLVGRDLRPFGGHLVLPLDEVLAGLGEQPVDLIHVGGEILTCEHWQAAVMTLPREEASVLLSRRDVDLESWAAGRLGRGSAPYVVAPEQLPAGSRTLFLGVGGVDLERATPALRGEVRHALGQASFLGLRDRRTLAHLAAAGLEATLMPDPACLAAELLAEHIALQARNGEAAEAARRFPGGYLAWQFSGDFSDDRTLAMMAGQVEAFASSQGLGVVLLRMGAAPWHDDIEALRRAAEYLAPGHAMVAETLHLLDICALIRGARLWCGSSLHGWILAATWGLPRVGLALASAGVGGKLQSYVTTWEPGAEERVVEAQVLRKALEAALASTTSLLDTRSARRLVAGSLGTCTHEQGP